MADRFDRALPLILAHEGGYVNHPKDPGGATNMGITQATYDDWCDYRRADRKDVRGISPDEVAQIYRMNYWDAVQGDKLPDGIAYATFDAAVNSGPSRAARWLQEPLGVAVDGVIGPQTLAAAAKCNPAQAITAMCAARLAFMRSLKIWGTFKGGWTVRVADVEHAAIKFAGGLDVAPAASPLPVAKAEKPERKSVWQTKTAQGIMAAAVPAAGGAVNSAMSADWKTLAVFGVIGLGLAFLILNRRKDFKAGWT